MLCLKFRLGRANGEIAYLLTYDYMMMNVNKTNLELKCSIAHGIPQVHHIEFHVHDYVICYTYTLHETEYASKL